MQSLVLYGSQFWINFNRGTYLKVTNIAYNNLHRRVLGYHRWYSASIMFVNSALDSFYVVIRKKKKNLFLFDHFVNTIHTYTLSMSYIYNLNNTNMKILANMVIMRINNNKSRVRRLL